VLKSLQKVAEVDTDFEWAKREWFEKMGICKYCETQCCWDESYYGSIDTRGEDFDLVAFNFGRI